MRIGEPKDYSDKHSSLYESWEGVCNSVPGAYPAEIYQFVHEQCNRFGLAYPPEEFVHYVIDYLYNICTMWDPYTMYYGEVTDIVYTDDWADYTYEVQTLDGDYIEADPQFLETFKIIPGRDLEAFQKVISHPGLEALEKHMGISIRDYISGELTGESIVDVLSPQTLQQLRTIAGCKENVDAYADLVTWAAFAWMIGPAGRAFRAGMSYIFDVCYTYGECILYEGCIFSPQQYRVVKRPPQSCVICGLDAWCVEMVYIEGKTRYMCEHHVNPTPRSKFHCGTKFCKHTECPHHPAAGQGLKAIDFVRMVHGHQQNMVEWNGGRKPKELPAK